MTELKPPTLTIELASVPDRDALVAEIWLGATLIAEVRREARVLLVQLYPSPTGLPFDVPYEELVAALMTAKARLCALVSDTEETESQSALVR
jgi:hypothetical protein